MRSLRESARAFARRWRDRTGRVLNTMLRPVGLRLVRRAAHNIASHTLGNVVQCHLADEALVQYLRQFRPEPSAKQAAELEALVYSPSWYRTYERHLEPLRQLLCRAQLPDGYRFLDVGSAVGQLLPHLRQMDFAGRYVGIDIGGPFLSIAHRRAVDIPWPAAFIQTDAVYLPFADNAFNMVFSRSALWATYDWEKALREILRVSSKWIILLDTPFHQGKEETAYFMQLSKNHAALLCTFTREALNGHLPPTAKVHVTPGEESEIINFGTFRWHNIVIELA